VDCARRSARRGHFSAGKPWKTARGPQYAAKKTRVERLYMIADREMTLPDGDPEDVFCVDES
jgi:hypothetical protein